MENGKLLETEILAIKNFIANELTEEELEIVKRISAERKAKELEKEEKS